MHTWAQKLEHSQTYSPILSVLGTEEAAGPHLAALNGEPKHSERFWAEGFDFEKMRNGPKPGACSSGAVLAGSPHA